MPTDEDYVDIAPTDVDYDNMTPEGKHTLQTAIEIFGGKIIPEDNK
jgi:DNA polymerase-3 subunit gamma/tau